MQLTFPIGLNMSAAQATCIDAVDRPSRDIGDILVGGFGTAVAMWCLLYLARLPGIALPAAALFVLLALLVLVAGWIIGRMSPRGWRGAFLAGLVTGGLNLLVLGSLLGKAGGASVASLWTLASILLTASVLTLGAIAATRIRPRTAPSVDWPAAFAWVAVAATASLLFIGGLVTGFEAGMAVPDWPGSFGYNMFWFPLARMTGGVYFEHAHRLFGSLVGFTTLVLMVYVQFTETRTWVRGLTVALFLAVVVQGVVGGKRVTENAIALAIIHGVFGQIVFASLLGLAVVVSRRWRDAVAPGDQTAVAVDRVLAQFSFAALLLQLVLGALLRHQFFGVYLHVGFAVFVFALVGALAARAWLLYESSPVLSRWGATLLALLGMQLVLGVAALIAITLDKPDDPPHVLQVLTTTAHQTTGALVLAMTVGLTVWQSRLLATPAIDPRPFSSGTSRGSESLA